MPSWFDGKTDAEIRAELERAWKAEVHYKEQAHVWCAKARKYRGMYDIYRGHLRTLKHHINSMIHYDG